MSLPRPGLRGKLALSIALVLLVALGVAFLAVYRGTGDELEDRTDTDLAREFQAIGMRMTAGGPATSSGYDERARQITAGETFGPNSRVVSISVDGGTPVTNQPDLLEHDPELQGFGGPQRQESIEFDEPEYDDDDGRHDHGPDRALEPLPQTASGFSTVEIDDVGEVRVLAGLVELPGGTTAEILVGQPLAPVETALEGLSDTFLIVGIAALLFGPLAGWLLANTATRPMRRMASVAEGVDGGDLSIRMPTGNTRDEARQLAESFNGMLDRLEETFDQQRAFVADASHDLRTPLTVVRGQIEVLTRDPDPSAEEVRRVSGLVSQATARMEVMVEDLLLLARSESAEGLDLEALSPGPLLAGEIDGLAFEDDRKLRLGSLTERRVRIDRQQISRAVSNLITNAVAHTSPGGKIEVSALDRGDWVVLAVDDDGPGIPESERDRIFDRFARLDRARTSSAGGSGLGLAIVKAIAEAHGGRVRCSDSPLGGARFEIELPAAPANL